MIEDPYYGSNEANLQWISDAIWTYSKTFDCNKQLIEKEEIELIFEGIDTYASITLNDTLLEFDGKTECDNMFTTWRVAVKSLLKEHENHLVVQFSSALIHDSIAASKLPYSLPDSRAFSRKAPYQYGWDWGPRFITAGLWRPVYLEGWSNFRIKTFDVNASINSLQKKADLTTTLSVESSIDSEATVTFAILENSSADTTFTYSLKKGENHLVFHTIIDSVKLWWPNGYGDQNLYSYTVEVASKVSTETKNYVGGMREVELVQEPDSVGKSFYFKINGAPIYAKGANYIPPDNFLPRVKKQYYRSLISEAVDANFNMIRVWGGGTYEKEIFYQQCDSVGLLVWQDFMFACNMYPTDKQFLDNCQREAEESVERLCKHPSIVLWCGNNEVKNGWEDWGWQKSLNYTTEDSTELQTGYLDLFEKILPNAVKKFDASTPYWATSPLWGWGRASCNYEGDSHYWGVWWGEEPFEMFREKVPRFMSEFGFQAYPALKTLEQVIPLDKLFIGSKPLATHQKHPRGDHLIEHYMSLRFPRPETFEDHIYVSQLLQAEGMRIGLEAQRAARPYCMGSLYWQFNDCWPVVSWSSSDYYLSRKALHYTARNCFEPILITTVEQAGDVKLSIVNDHRTAVSGELKIDIQNFYGESIFTESQPVEARPEQAAIYWEKSISDLPKFKPENAVMVITFTTTEQTYSALHYFTTADKLNLPESLFSKTITASEDGFTLEIMSENLIKNLYLVSPDCDGVFSDNFMDILPGQMKIIHFKAKKWCSISDFKRSIEFKSLNMITI